MQSGGHGGASVLVPLYIVAREHALDEIRVIEGVVELTVDLEARGRINRLSFFLHNFMDACSLEKDRIDACSFFTITRDGPVSMCLANAKRDDYILLPIEIPGSRGEKKFWEPLTGETTKMSMDPRSVEPTTHSIKHLKGRSRQIVAAQRASEKAAAIASRGKQPAARSV